MCTRAFVILALSASAFAQKADAPAFEAASVKPNHSGSGSSHWNTRPANVSMENVPLRTIIQAAYEVKEYQIVAPDWVAAERYDVVAKAAVGSSDKEMAPMLRTLLAERFKLQSHWETRDLPVYALVPAKSGFKLKPMEAGEGSTSNTTNGVYKAKRVNMQRFAEWLARFMDRPVVDMTGINGDFEFTLTFTRDENRPEPDKPQAPILPLAIQEQLGLRLEKRTAPIDVVVIDHAEKVPVEN